jgi:hypothetical protein
MSNTINFNRETPTHDSVARFYLTPIDSFQPWKYVNPVRLDEILKECYQNGTKSTKNLIEKFYNVEMPKP